MNDPLAPYRWLQADDPLGEIYCVSYFRGLAADEVVRRFGVHADLTYGGAVAARVGGWSVALEPGGWEATLPEVLEPLSKGTEVVVVGRHDHAEDRFAYAVDGAVVTSFRPISPSDRHGVDADRFNGLMREVGLTPEEPAEDEWEAVVDDMHTHGLARAFLLAARITGLPFTPRLLDELL